MSVLLSVRDLRRQYVVRNADHQWQEFVAVDGVSFDLAAGESLAVVGQSGSGKTTIARIVAGLDSASSGQILFEDLQWVPPRGRRERQRRAREVQMVFQDPYSSFDPRQSAESVMDEVLVNDGIRDRSARRARMVELMAAVGLDESYAPVTARALSGGQRQRLAIARALATRPNLLILDEAVAALDVSVQAQILNLLADLREQTGVAYLFISHDISVVRHVSDRCLVMHHGRVVEEGPTQQVLSDPQDDYTQQLLQAQPRPGWTPRRRLVAR